MATTLISADFDVDEEGFVFRDDAFRDTNEPLFSDGQRIPAGGFSGGALQVLLGGIDDSDVTGMSGGWDRDFNLATPQQVTLTFRVKLTQSADYEPDEFSEALVSLDGTLLSSNGGDFIAQINGNGNGGGPRTTDWIEVEINLGILAAGNHTLTFGGFNNKKTLANEETEILFDDIEVVADDPPPNPGEGVLIDANFDTDTNGFVFLDDTFRGTNEPAFADGQRTATGGFSGGGLEVTLGGIDNTDVNGMSGGWQTSFNLAEEALVTITFRYNLTQAPNYEANEFSQVLLSLDGTLIGIDGNDFIDQINGNGNGGPPRTTGWQVVEINLGLLGPGNHSLILGGFNNRKTFADEETTLLLDDVLVTELPPPPPGDVVILQSDFDSDTGGFGFIDDAFRSTSQPDYADGQRSTTAGFGGGGALTVELGNIDDDDILGMSGGWQQTFNLAAETDAVLSFRYKLTQAPNYENDEFSQVLVDLDGTLITPNGNDFIDQITGNGNGGPERSTGWQVVEIDLGTLSAGNHTLTIGGFNNKKTFADESTEILIDDLLLTAASTAPILDLDLDDSAGVIGTGYTDVFTEQGDGPPPVAAGVAVPIGDVDVDIDDPDSTQIQSATITLTNPQTGDQLSLFGGVGSLPAGISLDVSSTTSNIILTGLASLADYETAIELVRFATGADDIPDTTQRVINVVVVDEAGTPSNTAVATIDVVATNDFPTLQDDDFGTTDEDAILAAGGGGLLLGSLFDDNSSGLDSDPEGDDIDVSAVSGIVTGGLPAGTAVSGVNDGGTNFNFTLTALGQVATVFIDKETGNVNVEATTGDFFGLLTDADTATISFDYAIADPQGSNGTTATATFDVTGIGPGLDLDANDSSGAATATGYTDTFTEQGDGPPPVAAGVAVPIGDVDVAITSAATQMQGVTITLTNPQTGDQLLILGGAGALPAGISLDGASTASNIILTGLASAAAYETAIELIRFATGADGNPDTTQRIVNVVVVDDAGEASNTAVATIDVIATNDFPDPFDDDLGSTDEDTILAAGGGGVLLGSVFDDNSSGADDDPEGDDIDVASVSNIVPSGLPAGTVVSGVNDGGTNFNFTLTALGRVATVIVDKESGNVNVEATAGDYFGLLGTADTATISFDYTIEDPQGSNGTTATASFDVTGAADAPELDLDADDSSGAATATGYTDTFTEQGDGPPPVAAGVAVPVGDADVLITSDAAQLQSATITLTNPQTGDQLLISGGAGTLPGGITVDIASTATNLILTGLASAANYKGAIELVRFATGADDNPDTTQRVINVTVTDDTATVSNTAVATIDVIATNDFPDPFDDDLGSTDEDTILAAAGGGVLLGSVFDDNGSGADDDPEGDDIDVSAVSNVVTSSLPGGTVVSGVNDGGTNFNFTLTALGRVATVFIDKESGNVNVEATTGDFFGLLGAAGTASISFDYAITDPQGSNATTATASFDVTGVADAPELDLDADDSSGAATATGYTDTFTEQGDGPPPVAAGVAVPVGDTDVLITSDATQLQSATIALTNAQTGDQLLILGGPGALPGGIAVDGASTATNLILTGLASAANYEGAIELVRFATGADDTPDTTQRVINVTVTDDTATVSNTAVATIDVIATNDFPDPFDDDLGATDEGAILGAGVGGLSLGSVFADNSSGADNDPEGDDIDVSAVSNIQTSSLPGGAVVSGVNDGGTNFNFTLTAGVAVATVIVNKETGDVSVEATTGDFFGLLGSSDTASISFDYAIADPQGSNGTTATASFTVDGLANIVFIDNSVSGGGNNGSQSDPFESIAAFNAANTPGPGLGSDAIIFVRTGTGTYSETDGLKLQNGQTLLGQERADLLPASVVGETVGTAPEIVTTGGTNDGILLGSGNTIRGLDIGNTTGSGLSDGGGTVGILTISDVAIGGSGKALDIDQGGTLAATFESITSTSSASEGIDLAGLGGTFSVTGATTISGNAGNGIDITGNTGSFTFNGLDVTTSAASTGIGLNATGGGTLNVTGPGSEIDTTAGTGTAVNINGTTIGASGVTFRSIDVDGAANGIVLDSTGNGTFTVTGDGSNAQNDSGGVIANTTSHGIVLDDTGGFSISSMEIQDPGNSDTFTGLDIDGIQATEIRGINLIRGVEFFSTNSAGGDSHAIELENNGVSLEEFRIVGSEFNDGLGGSSAIRADLEAGTINGNFIVIGSTFEDHSVAAVDFAIGDGTVGSGTINIIIADNAFIGRSDVVVGNDIIINVQDDYTVNAQVHNNTITEVKPAASLAGVINAVVSDLVGTGPDVDLRFTENTIDEIRGRRGFNIILEENVDDFDVTLFDNLVTDLVDGTGPAVNALGREAVEIVIEDDVGNGQLRIVENILGTVAEPVAGNGSREGIQITVADEDLGAGVSADVLIHANDIVVSGVSSGEAIELDIEGNASIDLTVTDNNLTGGSQDEGFTIETEDAGSTADVKFTGNTSQDEIEFDREQGTLTITDRDDLAADNPGVTDGTLVPGTGVFTLVDSPLTTTTDPDLPTGVVLATDGLAQVVEINAAAGELLEVTVLNANGTRASGVTVTFAVVGAGPGGTFTGGATAVTNAGGVATKAFTANGTEGAYEITATAPGFEGATFLFQNEDSPAAFLTATEVAEHALDGADDLSQAALDATVAAAEARWAEANLSAGQRETLQGLSFEIADLEGAALGVIRGNQVQIDVNAAGHGWYVDDTPFDDSEFIGGDGIESMDLLTTVMHEMGHSLGLDDLYSVADADDLMYALLETGERRTPGEGQAEAALGLGELLGGDGGIAGLEGNAAAPASGEAATAAAYDVAGLGDPANELSVVA